MGNQIHRLRRSIVVPSRWLRKVGAPPILTFCALNILSFPACSQLQLQSFALFPDSICIRATRVRRCTIIESASLEQQSTVKGPASTKSCKTELATEQPRNRFRSNHYCIAHGSAPEASDPSSHGSVIFSSGQSSATAPARACLRNHAHNVATIIEASLRILYRGCMFFSVNSNHSSSYIPTEPQSDPKNV
jgi:hypothetical protein